jgi:hypothetical protein
VRKSITAQELEAISEALGVTPNDLLGPQSLERDRNHSYQAAFPPPEQVRPTARVMGLPRPPTSVFVGRAADYEQLAEALSTDSEGVVIQAVCGMGGVGKSELVLQYAHRARERYRLVWWVTAETPQQVEAALADLARHLVPDAARQASTEEAAAWAVGWLRTHPGWLLVLDNVMDPGHITGLLGLLDGGHVLITSRRDVRWSGAAIAMHLDLLAPEAAAELIITISGHTTTAGWRTALASWRLHSPDPY